MHFQKPPLGTPLDWSNPLNDGVVLHLAMNEKHGDKVHDSSMNGNHGMLKNFAFPPTVISGWNPGKPDIALQFGGSTGKIDCSNNPILDILGDITMSIIVRRDRFNTNEALISRAEFNVSGYEFYITSSNVLRYRTYQAAASQITDSTTHTLTGDHELLMVTREGTSATIYRDGIDITNVHGSHTDPVSNTHNLHIGMRSDVVSLPFKGMGDQVRIHTRALTPKEARDYAINPWQVYLDE